ncbi:hypothetical protein N0V86_008107 [Didymella sp. IMI 355093]|nr:hypothetical protein N0V86_008107 [Didymella sp. IMI 355093]
MSLEVRERWRVGFMDVYDDNEDDAQSFDNESEDSEMKVRAKQPCQSLFGGGNQDMEIDEQVDNLLTPATPGLCLSNRMSILTLDQQEHGDEVARPMNNGFSLACSDVGSVHDSPAPSDDKFVILPDTVVDRGVTLTWRLRNVSEYMRRLDKDSNFSANACRRPVAKNSRHFAGLVKQSERREAAEKETREALEKRIKEERTEG